MDTNPRNLIMRDYARHDERSAAVRSLGRPVELFSKDVADETTTGQPGFLARHGNLLTAVVGVSVGVALVAVLHGS